jgi:hypothetical protein
VGNSPEEIPFGDVPEECTRSDATIALAGNASFDAADECERGRLRGPADTADKGAPSDIANAPEEGPRSEVDDCRATRVNALGAAHRAGVEEGRGAVAADRSAPGADKLKAAHKAEGEEGAHDARRLRCT